MIKKNKKLFCLLVVSTVVSFIPTVHINAHNPRQIINDTVATGSIDIKLKNNLQKTSRNVLVVPGQIIDYQLY